MWRFEGSSINNTHSFKKNLGLLFYLYEHFAYMSDACEGEKKSSSSLGGNLVVSHLVDVGNGNCKSKSIVTAELFLLPLTLTFSTLVLN